MNNEEMKFTVLNDEGREIECEVLLTFKDKEAGINYIVYTDDTLDAEGNTKVYASILDLESDDEKTKLLPIENDEEWAIIEMILEHLQEEVFEDYED